MLVLYERDYLMSVLIFTHASYASVVVPALTLCLSVCLSQVCSAETYGRIELVFSIEATFDVKLSKHTLSENN